MKINLKEAIKDLAGKDIKDGDSYFTIGKALSNILIDAKEGGRHKLFLWATKCFNDTELEVDAADLAVIKTAVEKTQVYNNLVNGQLIGYLEALKSSKEK